MAAIPNVSVPATQDELADETSLAIRRQDAKLGIEDEIDPQYLLTDDEIRTIIAEYEESFGMNSEEFMRRWRAGLAPDTFETNAWAILLSTR